LEENIKTWNARKTDKYKSQVAAIAENGWKIDVLALEVGAKGWIPPSFFRLFKSLGFRSKRSKRLADNCGLRRGSAAI